jgi:hypothetical protein
MSDEHPPQAAGRGLILAGAVTAVYAQTFSVPLLFDDNAGIGSNSTIRHWSTAWWGPIRTTAAGRPIVNLSLAMNFALSGLGVWSYHAVNLAVHILAALTLFGIVRRTLLPRRDPATAANIAFCSALLWALHPLQTEAVTYIVQRAESLMGLFYLLTLYCFIRYAEAGSSRPGLWAGLSVAFCLLGMATKEVMVSAPVMVLLYDRTFLAGDFQGAWRRHRRVYAGLAATWALLPFLVHFSHNRGGTAGFGDEVAWGKYALTQPPGGAGHPGRPRADRSHRVGASPGRPHRQIARICGRLVLRDSRPVQPRAHLRADRGGAPDVPGARSLGRNGRGRDLRAAGPAGHAGLPDPGGRPRRRHLRAQPRLSQRRGPLDVHGRPLSR